MQAAGASDWNLSCRRCFGEAEMEEWRDPMAKLEEVRLSEENDNVCWKLEHLGKFSTRSIYRYITYAGVIDL